MIRLDDGQTLIAHLGMSGRMTLHDAASAASHPLDRHDHVVFDVDDGWQVRFNDARRFGLMLLLDDEAVPGHKLFKGLGPEPLEASFDGPALAGRLKGRKTSIKAALLDQKTLVGVGNIYACEALFLAGISPRRSAHTVQGDRAVRLVEAIKRVLHRSIEDGGSTLRDHIQPGGELGYFQTRFNVYDRAGIACPTRECGRTVRRLVQRHKALRAHTRVYRPGGVYGRRQVREFTRPTVCLFNGKPLTRKDWKRTTVGLNDVVAFHSPPTGGGGLRMLASIVLIAVAAAATWWAGGSGGLLVASALGVSAATGSAIAVAGVAVLTAAASMGISALFSPPAAPTAGAGYAGGTPSSSPVYNLTAQGNYARLNSPIPEAFGRNRMFPDFVTTPYANYDSSNDQYLHYILGLGIGEFDIDEDSIKLGDTPITSYEDIEYQIMEPGDLADTSIADERWITATDVADVELEDSAAGSPYAGPFAVVPAGVEIDRIEIDTSAPRGIWAFDAVVYLLTQNITFEVEARLIDDAGAPLGSWETFTPITKTDNTQEALRFTDAITLPSTGRWEVRMRRTDLKNVAVQAGHEIHWAGLRGRIIGRVDADRGQTKFARSARDTNGDLTSVRNQNCRHSHLLAWQLRRAADRPEFLLCFSQPTAGLIRASPCWREYSSPRAAMRRRLPETSAPARDKSG